MRWLEVFDLFGVRLREIKMFLDLWVRISDTFFSFSDYSSSFLPLPFDLPIRTSLNSSISEVIPAIALDLVFLDFSGDTRMPGCLLLDLQIRAELVLLNFLPHKHKYISVLLPSKSKNINNETQII